MNYRPEIDGLRAFAVLPVILFHAGFEWFDGGFVGVDVFFVISGYLITNIIISEMDKGTFSLINFYERRTRRLLPALFFVMFISLPFAWLWLTPNDLKDFGQSLIAVATFSSNIFFWLESGYFDDAAELKPLLHTWSLAVEEQFYLLFPLLLLITWRLGIKTILFLLSIAFLVSLFLAIFWIQNSNTPRLISGTFFLLPSRGWELLIGVFAAFYLKNNLHFSSYFFNQLLSILGIGMIVYSIITFDESTPFPGLYALIPTIGTLLLIICAVPKTFVYKLLSMKLFVGMGLISYSTYLWHQPLLAFYKHRFFEDESVTILIFLCLMSIFIAWLTWLFVERPFRQKNDVKRTTIFKLLASFIILFISIGLILDKSDGAEYRISKFQEFVNYKDITLPSGKNCFEIKDIHETCRIGKGKEIVFIGDSHLLSLVNVFMDDQFSKNYTLIPLIAGECYPVLGFRKVFSKTGIEQESCSFRIQNERFKLISELDNPIIVVGGRLPLYLSDGEFFREEFDTYRPFIAIDGSQYEYVDAVEQYLHRLAAISSQLILIYPIPEFGFDQYKLYSKGLLWGKNLNNSYEKKYFNERSEKAFDLLNKIEGDNVLRVFPSNYVCRKSGSTNNMCSPIYMKKLIYSDENHFNSEGAKLLLNDLKVILN